MSQTWLITGASSGLGTASPSPPSKPATKSSHSPQPHHRRLSNPQIAQLGGIWIPLDVTHPDTATHVSDAITHQAGGVIDVVVNNAGYSLLGSIEDMSEAEIQTQFSTNVFGPVRVLKGALPFMRKKRAGTVVNISSSAGVDGAPACAMYAGSKFAVEGMSESLSKELQPFGIRVVLVEPGYFRTKFFAAFVAPEAGLTEDYIGTPVEAALKLIKAKDGSQKGDPVKAAQRILEVVTGTGMGTDTEGFLRVPLGQDCYNRFQAKCDTLQANLVRMKEIAYSTGFDA
ncbi:putative short chain oxidoreductase/dehydrogenase [Aspergillus sclerotioniger CBS 115572]|uniref:Putative short chain oxidoreductase/dehydrogenase n=1 Tax=Aspergillus sclerotioniger CBS 115572 TaxID=1450535 RepID=A0A317W4C9_9EURO|nr:putative short chain oxidoreductase/dehydrogenase [Aspergillus sclerotioniger CBS 115572]PWY80471.1 putative short chain oxidoreductase/dehydrogenase [Aspergillus sclerotioniger CBS 115572]